MLIQEPPINRDPRPRPVPAFIGLGSNLDDPIDHVRRAFDALKALPHTQWIAGSSLYRSAPMGPVAQSDFINAIAQIETHLAPEVLLNELLSIERLHGRVRGGLRWGPRTLDLDLLIYGAEVISTPQLQIPHPGISQRNFVLLPLAELAPDLHIPNYGSVRSLMETVSRAGIARIG